MSEPQELQITEITIAKLDVKPGETLLVEVPTGTPIDHVNRLRTVLRQNVPSGIKILITTADVKFSVIKEAT